MLDLGINAQDSATLQASLQLCQILDLSVYPISHWQAELGLALVTSNRQLRNVGGCDEVACSRSMVISTTLSM